jgi:hypothetical protein
MTRRTPKYSAAIATGTGRRDGERSGHLWKSNPVNLELARARLRAVEQAKAKEYRSRFPRRPRYSQDPSRKLFRVGSQIVA